MFTSEQEQEERLEICRACPKYRKKARYFFGLVKIDKEQCAKCTCLLEPKTAWAASDCPLNKWNDLQKKN